MTLKVLEQAAGLARPATPADAVGGRRARFVAIPDRVDRLAALLQQCHRDGLAAVPRGNGTKLDWGPGPSTVDVIVDTAGIAGVRQYSGSGRTVTVGAGTPLRALQRFLTPHGQRLALDPDSADATVGGMLATNEAGPLAHRHGRPRSQLIGFRCVGADGGVRCDGADLGRASGGARGGLGVLTEATFRVGELPSAQVFVSRSVSTPVEVAEVVEVLQAADCAPDAIEVDLPRPSRGAPAGLRTAGRDAAGTLAVLFEDRPRAALSRASAGARLIEGSIAPGGSRPAWWGRYPFGPGDIALRLSARAADLPAAIYALGDVAGAPVPVRGRAGFGVLHAALPGDLPVGRVVGILDAVRMVLLGRGGSCEVLTAPESLRARPELWCPEPDAHRQPPSALPSEGI